MTSHTNGKEQNTKRKFSAIESVPNAKIGRRMDMVFKAGRLEYGALEIGQKADDTKELRDSRIKLSRVMKDMRLTIMHAAPKLLRSIHIVGCNIDGML